MPDKLTPHTLINREWSDNFHAFIFAAAAERLGFQVVSTYEQTLFDRITGAAFGKHITVWFRVPINIDPDTFEEAVEAEKERN